MADAHPAVSLEAIFLSTFVMIGQNRQGPSSQAKADHDFLAGEQELKLNTELTRAIHDVTLELHDRLVGEAPAVDRDGRRAALLSDRLSGLVARDPGRRGLRDRNAGLRDRPPALRPI